MCRFRRLGIQLPVGVEQRDGCGAGGRVEVIRCNLALLRLRTSQAVPAFARRESAKCQMCHFYLPELNEDGHSYIRRGLREEREGMAHGHGDARGGEGSGRFECSSAGRSPAAGMARLPDTDGAPDLRSSTHEKAAVHPGEVEAWIGGPLDQHLVGGWSYGGSAGLRS